MQLIHAWECPYCAKARIAMHEKTVSFESEVVDLRHLPDRIEQLNPEGSVPILLDDGQIINGSLVIAEYLEDRFQRAGTRLLPFDPLLRARVRTLLGFTDELAEAAYTLMTSDGNRPTETAKEVAPLLSRIAEQLDGKSYLVGNFSLADIALVPHLFALREFGISLPGRLPDYIAHALSRRSVGGDPYFERTRQSRLHRPSISA